MTLPLIVIGNVNVDLVMGPQAPWPVPGTESILPRSELRVGGAAGNVALAWQGLDAPFHLIANTSADALGRWLREPFGTAADAWPASPKPCGISVGLTHPGGERTFFTTLGHLEDLDVVDVLAQVPQGVRRGGLALLTGCFVTPRLMAGYGPLIAALDQAGWEIALDTGWPTQGWSDEARACVLSWLPGCRHLLVNEVEALGLSGAATLEAAATTLAAHLAPDAVLAIKAGPDGAYARHDGETLHLRPPPVRVVDTIGAGDTFNAGYLLAVARGYDWRTAVAEGVATAAKAIATSPRQYGPSRSEDIR